MFDRKTARSTASSSVYSELKLTDHLQQQMADLKSKFDGMQEESERYQHERDLAYKEIKSLKLKLQRL